MNWFYTFSASLIEILSEPIQRPYPRILSGLRVVPHSGVIEKGVVRVRIHDLFEDLVIVRHRSFDCRDALVDALIQGAVHRQDGSLNFGHIFEWWVWSIKRHCRP